MTFELKQANSINKDFFDVDAVMILAGGAFAEIVGPVDNYLHREKDIFENSTIPWHQFYIVDDGVVVSSLCLLLRDGNTKGKTDICFTCVNTNPVYRKQGWMEVLFNAVFDIYEKREMKSSKLYVSEETLGECFKFIDEQKITDGYWTLYSIVESYYAKYGFQGFRSLNFYKQEPLLLLTADEFELRNDEQFITEGNFCDFLYGDKYLPIASDDPNERSCGFKSATVPNMFRRLKMMLEFIGEPLNHFGLHIKSGDKETFIIVGQHFGPYEIMVQRIFTSVVKEDVLKEHMHRIFEYLSHYIKSNYLKFRENQVKDDMQAIWIAKDDVFTSDDKAKDIVYDFLSEKGWSYDDTNMQNLAMVREWYGKPKEGLKWTYNGFWSYN